MSAASQTKIFGMRLGVDPKILVGGLIAFAVFLFWYNSRGDEETGAPATGVYHPTAVHTPEASSPARIVRRSALTSNRGTLRLRAIDATQGDVDPTLRLDLLARLRSVKLEEGGRSLFEVGPPPLTQAQKDVLAHSPVLHPKPPPQSPTAGGPPPLNIPLQYYGFVKGAGRGQANRGLFLDGDNVLVASEGEVLKQRYLVVEVAATGARVEDVQLKQGKMLPVVPVATVP